MTQPLMVPAAGRRGQLPPPSAPPLDQIEEADGSASLSAAYSHRADYTGEGWDHLGYCSTAQEAHHD